jgi:hypothetical protein
MEQFENFFGDGLSQVQPSDLSDEQHSVLMRFYDFLNNNNQVMILTGRAGTGKTTLLSEFARKLRTWKPDRECKLMGPTGRSVKVLRDKIKDEKIYTIYKNIYASSKVKISSDDVDDLDVKKLKFIFPLRRFSFPQLWIIDEASLISGMKVNIENESLQYGSGNLLKDILTSSGVLDSSVLNKVVFVGDKYQLFPITDDRSPALDSQYFHEKGILCEEVELNQVLRKDSTSGILQYETDIVQLLSQDRDKRSTLKVLANNRDVVQLGEDEVLQKFSTEENQGKQIITYTNKKALQYNLKILSRTQMGSKLLKLGDRIIFHKNNYHTYYSFSNENCREQVEIIAGDFAEVIMIHERKIDDLEFVIVDLKLESTRQVIEKCYLLESFLTSSGAALSDRELEGLTQYFYRRHSEIQKRAKEQENDFEHSEHDTRTNSYWRALSVNLNYSYQPPFSLEQKSFLKNELAENPNADPKLLCERIIFLEKETERLIKEDPIYNCILAKWAYAITGHKSQGGEWDTVLVDFEGRSGLDDDSLRWCYTTISRAKQQLYIIDPPVIDIFRNMKINDVVQHWRPTFSYISLKNYQPSTDLTKRLLEKMLALQSDSWFEIQGVEEDLNRWTVNYHLKTDYDALFKFTFTKNKGFSKLDGFSLNNTDLKLMNVFRRFRGGM